MAELMFPNVAGNALAGFQQGQQMQANRLLGQYIADPNGNAALLGQAAQINPGNALDVQQSVLANQGTQTSQRNANLVALAKIYQGAPDAMKPSVAQKLTPALQAMGLQVDGYDPQQWDQTSKAIIQAYTPYNAMPAAVRTAQYFDQGLSPEDQVKAQRIHLGLDPRANNPSYSMVQVPDGQGGKIQAFYNKKTGKIELPDYSALEGAPIAQPSTPGTTLPNVADPMLPLIQQANARVAAGEDPDKVEADLASQAAKMQGTQGTPTATLGYTPPKSTATKGQVNTLGADEIKAIGLPEGTVAQRDANGKITVISKPPQMSAAQEVIQAQKAQKAAMAQQDAIDSIDDTISKIDSLKKHPGYASLGTFLGGIGSAIPHTDAADAKAQLDTITSQGMINIINKMKSLSATGATGFGQLSDKEGEVLRNATGNLSTQQSHNQLDTNLDSIKANLIRQRNLIAGKKITFSDDSQAANSHASPQGWSIKRID